MEGNDNNFWQPMVKQLIIRLAECILENRFPETKSDSMISYEDAITFPFNKTFSGKFGLSKDLK